MKTFKLTAKATISISTIVEAETLAKAIAIARRRELGSVNLDPTYEESAYWLADEVLDGTPEEIREDT